MRILIVDDSKTKNEWIRDGLDGKGIQYDEIKYRHEALTKIHENPDLYAGIILDMQFPLYQGCPINQIMGEKFLKRLKSRGYNIPVLGNSTLEFPSSDEYPFLRGNTNGEFNPQVLNEFLNSL